VNPDRLNYPTPPPFFRALATTVSELWDADTGVVPPLTRCSTTRQCYFAFVFAEATFEYAELPPPL
jgi:hypothetical protein